MKDQYFGDARDYLKYQLLEELLARVPRLKQLVCVWMLTPPDNSGQGGVQFVANPHSPQLAAFLQRHLSIGDRRVRHMREYFAARGISYVPWGDQPPYFTNATRAMYFSSLPDETLRGALVFLDPDNGLATGRLTAKHVSFEELVALRDRMDADSLTVFYQHSQRRRDFWEWMATTIRERLEAPVGYVTASSVGFFVIPNNPSQTPATYQALEFVARLDPRRQAEDTRL